MSLPLFLQTLRTDVAIRNQGAVEDALVDFLALFDGPVRSKDTYGPLADQFELTIEERTRQLTSRPGRAWDNCVQWARNALLQKGLLDNSLRAHWSLTPLGRQVAKQRVADDDAITSPDFIVDGAEAFIDVAEGRKLLRTHLVSERSKTLIDEFKKRLGSELACKACGFDFGATYGSLGIGYIEAHHTLPVSAMTNGSTTKVTDLIALCANCHRMVHRNGLITVQALKAILRQNN